MRNGGFVIAEPPLTSQPDANMSAGIGSVFVRSVFGLSSDFRWSQSGDAVRMTRIKDQGILVSHGKVVEKEITDTTSL